MNGDNLYATCRHDGTEWIGQIWLNGEARWKRFGKTPIDLADQLRRIRPDLDHVMTPDNGIQDTGALTLAECLEAVAWRPKS